MNHFRIARMIDTLLKFSVLALYFNCEDSVYVAVFNQILYELKIHNYVRLGS